jgi:hypothetical protein
MLVSKNGGIMANEYWSNLKVFVAGNGKDKPDVTYLPAEENGKKVSFATTRVSASHALKDRKTGEYLKDETGKTVYSKPDYAKIKGFGAVADAMKDLKKGDYIDIACVSTPEAYINGQGEAVPVKAFTVAKLEKIDLSKKNQNGNSRENISQFAEDINIDLDPDNLPDEDVEFYPNADVTANKQVTQTQETPALKFEQQQTQGMAR